MNEFAALPKWEGTRNRGGRGGAGWVALMHVPGVLADAGRGALVRAFEEPVRFAVGGLVCVVEMGVVGA